MAFRHLKIFVTICEAGSMTVAAFQLFIIQPSISLAISEMEEYYGVKLFGRISHKLYLTESGRRALQCARHITDLLNGIEQGVRDVDAMGRLKVGTSITIGACLLPEYIKRLKQQYPTLKVKASIVNSETIEQQVSDDEIDVGVIEGVAHSHFILSESFAGDRLAFICSVGHEFAGRTLRELAEVRNQDFILWEKGSAGGEIFDDILAAQELNVRPIWQSASNQVILQGVKAGLGISILPYFLIHQGIRKGGLAEFRIEGLALSREYSVIYRKNKFLPRNARTLMELCRGENRTARGLWKKPLAVFRILS